MLRLTLLTISLVSASITPCQSAIAVETPAAIPASATPSEADPAFTVFPVALTANNRSLLEGILIWGKEDGSQPVEFDRWLVPFDAVIQALKFSTKALPDGQLELRSSFIVTRFDPKKLRNDPEIGPALSIQDLKTLLGVEIKFDLISYAIVLKLPEAAAALEQAREAPVSLEGLSKVAPPTISLSAIEQRTNATGSSTSATQYQGDLLVVGSLAAGSWSARVRQPDLTRPQTWNLGEVQYLQQSNTFDLALGSQPKFWRSQKSGEYWAATIVIRRGFAPPAITGTSFSPTQRLQSNQVGQTIVGKAAPGTSARLTRSGFGGQVLAEVLVDSTGIYRFENIPFGESAGSAYRILLYPNGQLTARPQERAAVFNVLPGQIPQGASALIISGGWQRDKKDNFLGDFTTFSGGLAQRWGLSESLTVGLGGLYDSTPKALAELYFHPRNFPIRVVGSALGGTRWDINLDIQLQPSPSINVLFQSDRLSSQFSTSWQVIPNLGLLLTTDSRIGLGYGVQVSTSLGRSFLFGTVAHNESTGWNWTILQSLGKLQFTHVGRDIGTSSKLSYNFSDNRFLGLTYETRTQGTGDKLLTALWHYNSLTKASDGTPNWLAEVGYGIGSRGSGLYASAGVSISPGLLLRVRYQGVALTSDQSSFSLELVSSTNFQQGFRFSDRQAESLHSFGGLMIQTFYDINGNNQKDLGEEVYANPNLLMINNRPINSYQFSDLGDRLLLRLPPGTYRLDLDPSGFPIDWQASVDALAVEVVAGSYTPLQIPLIHTYTVGGTVTSAEGKPIGGARVEAISNTNLKVFSITNEAGVYYLERLRRGNYKLRISGKPAEPGILNIEANSKPLQELNLKQPVVQH
ncbi:carboxypeptidase-like regulatory domain-containing protein [Leptolyngbya sp. NIES-2104]|uniref:carboxypeptidase-like regulatory domain-containing protein n=1 Tax=Leptolyngbya sp. NIES-2104 TaxID=1552121 RepID=UPI0006EC4A3E|nr:carboxypeptidase-like regulatory domain-containing protein [Leptolyngbya sp. NIES-2104]GAQ00061.1 hypothetical protein NIES2104_66260 [Leptolyngbya sp. NIES-2104]